jgi:hypothetical protein
MVIHLPLPQNQPASAEDAVASARLLLNAAGISDAVVSLEKPATVPGGLAGAVLMARLPRVSLEKAVHNAAAQFATQQGIKVTQTHLLLQQTSPNQVQLNLQVEAKVFGGTLQLGISGSVLVEGGTRVRFCDLNMESGGGMFAGVASAMIRPKLAALQAEPLEIEKLAGLPLELSELSYGSEVLVLLGKFSHSTPAA